MSLRTFSRRKTAGKFLPLILVAGVAGCFATEPDIAKASSESTEVTVTIVIPEEQTLTGTAIVILEDISYQDSPSVELARTEVPAASLTDTQARVVVPIDLQTVDSGADVNVAVLVDSDDSGDTSSGDWISDTLALVITNSVMDVSVDVVQVSPP